MTLLTGLNAEQRAAVEHLCGPLLIAAVAGCGKTYVIVQRIVHLIRNGCDPARILAVTFSTKAARVMTERLARLGCTDARVGTFHSLALQIIRSELSVGEWTIDDHDRYRFAVKDAVGYREMDWRAADVTYLMAFITRCKAVGGFASADDATTMELATRLYKRKPSASREPNLCVHAYETAERIRRERQLLTFDDMPFEAWALFRRDDAARQRWASRWEHVIQDECQDESPVQRELAAGLAREHRNYCIVGDPAQAIYDFRGSDTSGMLTFERDWGARVIRMGANYRSARTIIDVANRSLQAMPVDTHLGVTIVAQREDVGQVRLTAYDNFDEEGEGVTEKLLESHEDGLDWKDHVVLYRTNAQSRGVEEQLLSARVPYTVLGGTNFYDRREIKDLLAYLRIAAGTADFESLKRAINTPFRFLGKAFIEGLQREVSGVDGPFMLEAVKQYVLGPAKLQQRQRTAALEFCQILHRNALEIVSGLASQTATRDSPNEVAARPSRILESLVSRLRYAEWLTRDEGTESPENNRVSNVRELIRAADRFPTVGELLEYVDDTIARAAKAKKEVTSSDVVTLCSIHRCVHPDTWVETGRGMERIRAASSSGVVATAVGARRYRHKVQYAQRDLLTITTKNGYQVTVTTDHGMMVWDGDQYVCRQAGQLQVGDYLRVKLGATVEPVEPAVLPADPEQSARERLHTIPRAVTHELAEFLGLMVADGTLYRAGFRLKKRHCDVRDRFAELAAGLFGADAHVSGEAPDYIAEYNSTYVARWLVEVGGLEPCNKAVPECVLRSDSLIQASFLRGLFEDGTVNLVDETKLDHVSWSTSYPEMASTVHMMLLRQGIISSRFQPVPGEWRVVVYGAQTRRFRDRIGFVSRFKQARLALDSGADTGSRVPVSRDYIRTSVDRETHRFERQNALHRGYISRKVASELEMHEALGWHHVQITDVEPSVGPAMCVEVPGHGRFLQNGFDGANSKGLEWPVVFVIGLNDKILPHAYAENQEEERRLFYVACTRAADVLELSYVGQAAVSTRVLKLVPSPYLAEAGIQAVDHQPAVPEAS